jgi:hypothetical protein
LVSVSLEVADDLVEEVGFGSGGVVVGGVCGGFLVGPAGGFFVPMAPVPPSRRAVGVALGVSSLVAGVDELLGGFPFGGPCVAAMAGEQIGAVLAERGEPAVDAGELGAPVGWDGGGDRFPFGSEAGMVQGGSHPRGRPVVVFDGERVGGGGAGVDGPTGAVVDGPVPGEV